MNRDSVLGAIVSIEDCKANFFTEVFPFILQAAGHLDVESFELKKLDQGVGGFGWMKDVFMGELM